MDSMVERLAETILHGNEMAEDEELFHPDIDESITVAIEVSKQIREEVSKQIRESVKPKSRFLKEIISKVGKI